MESSESSDSADSFECENSSDEHEQTLRNLSARIERLKRVCDTDDSQDQDEDIVAIPKKKILKQSQSVSGNSEGSAGRSILSFFNKPVKPDRICNDTIDTDMQNAALAAVPPHLPVVAPVTVSRNLNEIPGSSDAAGRQKRSTKINKGRGTRDYSKNKKVCLLCAKSDVSKLRDRAILSRGGDYQINRHKTSCHLSIPLPEVSRNIVSINHISVPKSIRAKKSVVPDIQPVRKPDAEVTTRDDKSLNSDNTEKNDNNETENDQIEKMATSDEILINSPAQHTESSSRGSTSTASTTLQTDLSSFVKVTKQTFEEKVITMIEKLSNKVDNLKEARSTTAGNIIVSPCRCCTFKLVGVVKCW